jgi:hypothetical protein
VQLNLSIEESSKSICRTAYYVAILVGFIIGYTLGNGVFHPNEIGDYFAGFITPAVLYWIIISYRQQNRDIEIQARELAASVKAQNEMVILSISNQKLEELKAITCEMRLYLQKVVNVNMEPLNNLDKNSVFLAMSRYLIDGNVRGSMHCLELGVSQRYNREKFEQFSGTGWYDFYVRFMHILSHMKD